MAPLTRGGQVGGGWTVYPSAENFTSHCEQMFVLPRAASAAVRTAVRTSLRTLASRSAPYVRKRVAKSL